MTIFGRRHAVELVREIMTCHPGPQGEQPPVLVFEGERGSGKTALLTSLTSLLDGRVPYAHIDLGVSGRTGTPEVLYALAFHLGRPCPLYGTLRFPRLAVGKLVMNDTTLDLTDRDRARDQINRLLRAHRRVDQMVATLREGAGNLPAGLPAAAQVPAGLLIQFLAAVIDRLASWAWSSRFVLGRAQGWYGTQGSGPRNRPVETLIELNQWHRGPNAGNNVRQRDELLWAAFRADLRASLRRRLRKPWMPRCVVLLDNADTNLGRHFLTEIVRLRAEAEILAGGAGPGSAATDPLAVVATSREPFLDHLPAGDQRVLAAGERLVLPGPDHPGPGAPGSDRWPRWVRYPLTDLTDLDVAQKVKDLPRLDHRVPLLIQQFAQGNPLTTSLLLDTAQHVAAWPAGGNELGAILVRLEPSPPDDTDRVQFTIEERLSRHLLGLADGDPFPTDVVESLTTCAAARNVEQALILATGSGLVTPDRYIGLASSPVLASLWPSGDGGPLPPLRRLLLRRLAARGPDADAGWSDAHGWLRKHCAARGDRAGELYHALAAGELGYVAEHFADRSDEEPAGDWLAAVRALIRAPANLPHDAPPSEEAHRLARELGAEPNSRLGLVARLIAELWLAADPFSGRHRADLHTEIARDYRVLAPYLPNGHTLLIGEAARHERLADQWR
jgi:hypothetical protein